jgi:hypothetical protein
MTSTPLQVYFYDGYSWSVTDAVKLVEGRDPQQADITSWAAQLATHEMNETHWRTVDVSKPLIIANMPHTGEQRPIDGWHRIRRAHSEGITSLPAYFLSDEEELIVKRHEPA